MAIKGQLDFSDVGFDDFDEETGEIAEKKDEVLDFRKRKEG